MSTTGASSNYYVLTETSHPGAIQSIHAFKITPTVPQWHSLSSVMSHCCMCSITIYLLEQVIPVFTFLNCCHSGILCILETAPPFPQNQTILVLFHLSQ